jgi:hypothetical protein
MEPCILYADDVTLMADTATGLQQLITCMHDFCALMGLTISASKTEVLVCGERRWADRAAWRGWRLAATALKRSERFKYLGLMYDTTGSVAAMAEHRAKALTTAFGVAQRTFVANAAPKCARARLDILTKVAQPSGTYGCALWGPPLFKRMAVKADFYALTDPVERARLNLLKRFFRLRDGTPSACILWEFGMVPLANTYIMRAARFYNRMIQGEVAADLYARCMQACATAAADHDAPQHNWVAALARALDVFVPAAGEPWAQRMAARTLIDTKSLSGELEAAWAEYARGLAGTKTEHYFQHMATHKVGTRPKYISFHLPHDHICSMARFRLGSHYLRVETGRWVKPPIEHEDRKCLRCGRWVSNGRRRIFIGSLDDEFHMLFACRDLEEIRAIYGIEADRVRDLMSAHAENPQLVRYVHKCMATVDEAHLAARTQPHPGPTAPLYLDLPPAGAIPGAVG